MPLTWAEIGFLRRKKSRFLSKGKWRLSISCIMPFLWFLAVSHGWKFYSEWFETCVNQLQLHKHRTSSDISPKQKCCILGNVRTNLKTIFANISLCCEIIRSIRPGADTKPSPPPLNISYRPHIPPRAHWMAESNHPISGVFGGINGVPYLFTLGANCDRVGITRGKKRRRRRCCRDYMIRSPSATCKKRKKRVRSETAEDGSAVEHLLEYWMRVEICESWRNAGEKKGENDWETNIIYSSVLFILSFKPHSFPVFVPTRSKIFPFRNFSAKMAHFRDHLSFLNPPTVCGSIPITINTLLMFISVKYGMLWLSCFATPFKLACRTRTNASLRVPLHA